MSLIACTLFLVVSAAENTPQLVNAMPISVAGPWTIAVGPGEVVLPGGTLTLAQPVQLDVKKAEMVQVRDEEYKSIPVFNPNGPPWRKGTPLTPLAAEECSATGLLVPESVRVKAKSGDAAPLVAGVDYELEPFWADFGRKEGGAITPDQSVFVDYDYSPCRLDSVVVDAAGNVTVLQGTPAVAVALPPKPAEGQTAIANIWVPGRLEALTEENLYPIEMNRPAAPAATKSVAEELLPKTLAKLREGKPVSIVAWGDSVTAGGGVGNRTEEWYQNQFLALLRERFPQSAITLKTAGWGGANSAQYMNAPRGGQYDFVRDVLEPKPDLVTIEFVNDAYLSGDKMREHYTKIMDQMKSVGAEVILITPHYVRPDWMGVTTLKVSDDPRPYVNDLRQFAADNHIALADASKRWGELWRQGIPYTTYLANAINHPDVRGHALFAQTLMDLFPSK